MTEDQGKIPKYMRYLDKVSSVNNLKILEEMDLASPIPKRRIQIMDNKPPLPLIMKKEIAKQPYKDRPLFQEVSETLDEIIKAIEENKDLAAIKISNTIIKVKNKTVEEKEKQSEQAKKIKQDLELKWKLHKSKVKEQLQVLKAIKDKSPTTKQKSKDFSKSTAMGVGMKKFMDEKRHQFQDFKKENDEQKKKKEEQQKLVKIQEAQKKKETWDKFIEGQTEKLVNYFKTYLL